MMTILEASTRYLKQTSGAEMFRLINGAIELARKTGDYKEFREIYHREFRRTIACDSRETVPAVLALCYLADGDPQKAIVFGANFGRDTDTIATMAGAVCGAFKGVGSFPAEWVQKAEAVSSRDQRELAKSLVKVAGRKAAIETEAWSMLNGMSL